MQAANGDGSPTVVAAILTGGNIYRAYLVTDFPYPIRPEAAPAAGISGNAVSRAV